MVAGDFRVSLLVALDVLRKRIPDEAEICGGATAIAPAGQDDVGAKRHPHAADRAAAAAFHIGDVAAELDFGGAGVAMAGPAGKGATILQFPVEVLGRA